MLFADRPVTRRTALSGLAAIAAAGLVTSCSDESQPRPGEDLSGRLSHDEQAAIRAQRSVAHALDAVNQTSQARPGLAPLLSPIAAMHRAHLEILTRVQDPEPSKTPAPLPLPPDRQAALESLRTVESSLASELGTLARDSESGQWARVLASMSAAVQQRQLNLIEPPGGKS